MLFLQCLAVNYYYQVHTYHLPVIQGVLPKCLVVLGQPVVQPVQPKRLCTATTRLVPVFQDPQKHLGVVEIKFKTPLRVSDSFIFFCFSLWGQTYFGFVYALYLTDRGTYPQLPTQPKKKLFGFKLIQ